MSGERGIYETCPLCLARNEGGFAFPQYVRPCPEHDLPPDLLAALGDLGTVLPGEGELFEKVYRWAMSEPGVGDE